MPEDLSFAERKTDNLDGGFYASVYLTISCNRKELEIFTSLFADFNVESQLDERYLTEKEERYPFVLTVNLAEGQFLEIEEVLEAAIPIASKKLTKIKLEYEKKKRALQDEKITIDTHYEGSPNLFLTKKAERDSFKSGRIIRFDFALECSGSIPSLYIPRKFINLIYRSGASIDMDIICTV